MGDNGSIVLAELLAASPDAPQEFERVCAAIVDWKSTLDYAFHHGLGGVLDGQLRSHAYKLPPLAQDYIDRRRIAEQLWQRHLYTVLDEVLALLNNASIPTVILKGTPLSERLYGDAFVRLSSDIDLLLPEKELARAIALLAEIGYRAEASHGDDYARAHHHHICLERRNSPVIELHFCAYRGMGATIPSEELIERALRYHTAAGTPALVLAPEDEILYLAVHLAGHGFVQLSWLYDIKQFIFRYPRLDWQAVTVRARRYRVATAFLFAMKTLRARLRVELPAALDAEIARGLRARLGSALISIIDMRSMPPALARLGRLLLSTLLCESSGLAFLQHHLLRMLRRRIQHLFPGIAPAEWSA